MGARMRDWLRFARAVAPAAAVVCLVGFLLACCGTDEGGAPGVDRTASPTFLFAVISDTHIAGRDDEPQNQIFRETAEVFNRHVPPIDFVVCTGDLVERLPSDDPDYYRTHRDTPLDEFISLVSLLAMPLYGVMGNHDYYSGGILPIPTRHATAREELYVERGIVPAPYYAFEHRGVKFYCLNTMQQDPSVRWGPNAVGTLGPEQAAWLEEGL